MNIAQANAIPLSKILEILGHQPKRKTARQEFYLSPLRTEKTASFKVEVASNLWIDFGTGEGGDVVEFVCRYLEACGEDHTVADALRWIGNMYPSMEPYKPITQGEVVKYEPSLKLIHTKAIAAPQLIKWIEGRGIPLELAQKYLKQADLRNIKHGFNFQALALAHENAGYELMNNYSFKGSINGKHISFIRGLASGGRIHLFEGAFDFLSALCREGKDTFEDDAIILNSVAKLKEATGYIQTNPYTRIQLWLDNDKAGLAATAALIDFAEEKNLRITAQNRLYANYKDVNDWHQAMLKQK